MRVIDLAHPSLSYVWAANAKVIPLALQARGWFACHQAAAFAFAAASTAMAS